MKCVVIDCRRARLAPHNGITFATCEQHTRIDMETRDTRPEWVRRMQTKGLPAKEMTVA